MRAWVRVLGVTSGRGGTLVWTKVSWFRVMVTQSGGETGMAGFMEGVLRMPRGTD